MITAAHCICTKKGEDIQSGFLCRLQGQNEINVWKNFIEVLGGSSDRTTLEEGDLKWMLEENDGGAYVMNCPSDKWIECTDIGIAIIPKNNPNSKPFFNKDDLKLHRHLYRAPIVPICLTASYTDINLEKSIRGVGWGLRYEESPSSLFSIPDFSSCMTNEVGEEEWKFKGCDMETIIDAGWTCEKGEYPPNYPVDMVRKCQQYVNDADAHFTTKGDNIGRRALNEVDKIYITNSDGTTEVCYNHEHFTNTGWCKVPGPVWGWGFCSPSCEHDLMMVGKPKMA